MEFLRSSVACLFHFGPVAHEAFQPSVSQRVTHELTESFGGHRRSVCAELDALKHMGRMANGGCKDFRGQVVIGPCVHDFSDQFHAVMTRIVNSADEGRYVRGAGFCGHERLRGRENQCNVGVNAFLGENLGSR